METEVNRGKATETDLRMGFKTPEWSQEIRERMVQKNTGWDRAPRIKENGLRRETSEFGDRQGSQKIPFVIGGDVRTLGGRGTGSSRPALCVSHREWGTWKG